MSVTELTMTDVARDQDGLHAWLRAHDLDPNRTAPGVRIEDGQVTATLYETNPDGSKVQIRDEFTGAPLGPKTKTITIPLRQPLPAGLGTVTE